MSIKFKIEFKIELKSRIGSPLIELRTSSISQEYKWKFRIEILYVFFRREPGGPLIIFLLRQGNCILHFMPPLQCSRTVSIHPGLAAWAMESQPFRLLATVSNFLLLRLIFFCISRMVKRSRSIIYGQIFHSLLLASTTHDCKFLTCSRQRYLHKRQFPGTPGTPFQKILAAFTSLSCTV